MESQYFRSPAFGAGFQGLEAHFVHNGGNVDIIGAADRAGVAAGADPGDVAGQYLLLAT